VGIDETTTDFHQPQSAKVADYVPRSDKLDQSIILLRETVESGAALDQFEVGAKICTLYTEKNLENVFL